MARPKGDSVIQDAPEQRDSTVRNPEETAIQEDERSPEELLAILDKLGMDLAKTRSEAIDARAISGIENEWMEDEEHYEGIDDVNRGEMSAWRSKPMGQAALADSDDTGSTVFFNITRPFVDTASARVADMLLPADDQGWAIEPTPIPDSVAIVSGKFPYRIDQQIRNSIPDDDPDKEGRVARIKEEAVEYEMMVMEQAKEAAKKVELRIQDWHSECQYNAEMRKVIEDASKVGTGIMKGPVPEKRKQIAYSNGMFVVNEEVVPVSRRVDVVNCFPDLSCGTNIHNGSYHWEKDDITERDLRDLLDQPGYLNDQILKVIDEGPHRATKDFREGDGGRADQLGLVKRDTNNLYEIWYYYGRLTKENMEAAGCPCPEIDEMKVDAHVVMINNRVVRASVNHMASGEFPYDYMPWQARAGIPWGIGVSRQIRTPQRVVNGAGRNLMDNAGLAGGPMWAFNQGLIEPIDGIYEIAPRKGWFVSEDAEDPGDVSAAIQYITMDMMQADLQAIIALGMQFAEYISGMPSLLQGQQGEREETLGATQMRQNNGSTTLRRIARMYDDKITTPHLRRYYQYDLEYTDDPNKGDFNVVARGSSALVERDIQNQSIIDLASIVADPTYGLDKRKWAVEYLKSQRLDPKRFEFDDEEWEQVLLSLSQPPADTSVQVAEIKAALEQWKTEINAQVEAGKLQHQSQEKERDRQLTIAMDQIDKEFDMFMQANNNASTKDMGIDKLKGSLTETLMTLRAQYDLAGSNNAAPEVAEPVVEPPGRAPDGLAFQR